MRKLTDNSKFSSVQTALLVTVVNSPPEQGGELGALVPITRHVGKGTRRVKGEQRNSVTKTRLLLLSPVTIWVRLWLAYCGTGSGFGLLPGGLEMVGEVHWLSCELGLGSTELPVPPRGA